MALKPASSQAQPEGDSLASSCQQPGAPPSPRVRGLGSPSKSQRKMALLAGTVTATTRDPPAHRVRPGGQRGGAVALAPHESPGAPQDPSPQCSAGSSVALFRTQSLGCKHLPWSVTILSSTFSHSETQAHMQGGERPAPSRKGGGIFAYTVPSAWNALPRLDPHRPPLIVDVLGTHWLLGKDGGPPSGGLRPSLLRWPSPRSSL